MTFASGRMTEEHEQCDSLNSWELNGLNSLDLWDYTVELECLQGTEGKCCAKERGVAVALPAEVVDARQFEAQKNMPAQTMEYEL